MRASLGSTVSKRVTVCPPRARVRVRAVRKMVSPSGMSGGLGLGLGRRGLLNMAHLETEWGRDEAGLFEEAGEEMVRSEDGVAFGHVRRARARTRTPRAPEYGAFGDRVGKGRSRPLRGSGRGNGPI